MLTLSREIKEEKPINKKKLQVFQNGVKLGDLYFKKIGGKINVSFDGFNNCQILRGETVYREEEKD